MSFGRTSLLTGAFTDSQQNPLSSGVLTWQLEVDNPGGAPVVYYVAGDPANGEFVLPVPFTTPLDASGTLGAGVAVTNPQDLQLNIAGVLTPTNVYYLITGPDGITFTTTKFAYSAAPRDIGTVSSNSAPVAYTQAPVTFRVATPQQLGDSVQVVATLSDQCTLTGFDGVLILPGTQFITRLDGAGVGTLNLAPNDPAHGGILVPVDASRTAANVVWWISVNGGPNFPIQVPAAGGFIDDLIVGIDGQGTVVPVTLLTKLTVTGNVTLTAATDILFAYANAANIVVTLPDAVATLKQFTIYKTDSSAHTVTIQSAGGQTLNGVASLVLSSPYQAARPVSDTANWISAVSVDPTRLRYTGAYDNARGYVPNDVTLQSGIDYINIAPSTGNPPPNVTYWVALGGSGGGSDATTAAVGVVEIDRSTVAAHPVALTTIRLTSPHGVASLGGDGSVPSFALPTLKGTIPEVGRWAESASNPLIAPGASYDFNGINEPMVIFHQGLFKMWYVGAIDSNELHITVIYATCPGTSDPTVAGNWTKHGVVVAAPALEPFVYVKQDGNLRMFHSDHFNLLVKDSTDGGTTWTPVGTALATGVAGVSWWADSVVWQDETGLWKGLFEGGGQTGPWHIYHGSSADGVAFTLDGLGMITSLVTGGGGGSTMEGGPYMPVPNRHNGVYHLWYHSIATGAVPAQIYHATSTDPALRTWTINPTPIVAIGGSGIVDNASLLEVKGVSYLFWGGGGMGGVGSGGVHVAKFAGTLAQLVDGTNLAVGAGSVTNVSVTVPADETVTVTNPTTTPAIAITRATQTGNKVLASDPAGATAVPSFRFLVNADLPLATSTATGAVRPDNVTCQVVAGVLTNLAGGATRIAMQSGSVAPPVPLWNTAGTDYVYLSLGTP